MNEQSRNFAPRIPIFAKFMSALLIVVLLVGLLAASFARRAVETEFELYINGNRRRQTDALAQLLARYYDRNGGWDDVEKVLNRPAPNPAPQQEPNQRPPQERDIWEALGGRVLIADQDGIIVVDSAGVMAGQVVDERDLHLGSPIVTRAGQKVGTTLIAVGDDKSIAQIAFLQQMQRAVLIAVAIAGSIALLLGAVLTWGMIRPLRNLTTAVHATAHGDFSQRVQTRTNDEIGDLADAFNQMSSQLNRSETARRQMTADIAHELRTPLTVIQGNIEALQDGIFPLTADSLTPIADKTELLTRLVEDLRQLALVEAGQLHLDLQPVQICDLAARLVEAFQPIIAGKKLHTNLVEAPSLPMVNVDAQRLEQVFNNLLVNAIRHTPADGTVTINCQPDGGMVRVIISDTGNGIPADKLPHLFERFYRVDAGRGRTDGSGTGLGLAVAKSIVEAHGGEIGAENGKNGAVFWFTLPIN